MVSSPEVPTIVGVSLKQSRAAEVSARTRMRPATRVAVRSGIRSLTMAYLLGAINDFLLIRCHSYETACKTPSDAPWNPRPLRLDRSRPVHGLCGHRHRGRCRRLAAGWRSGESRPDAKQLRMGSHGPWRPCLS